MVGAVEPVVDAEAGLVGSEADGEGYLETMIPEVEGIFFDFLAESIKSLADLVDSCGKVRFTAVLACNACNALRLYIYIIML